PNGFSVPHAVLVQAQMCFTVLIKGFDRPALQIQGDNALRPPLDAIRHQHDIRAGQLGAFEAHDQPHFARLLPTSPRESRLSMAYSHPYASNSMTWRSICRSSPPYTRSTNWTNEPGSLSTGARHGRILANVFPKHSGIRPWPWPQPCRPRAWPNSYG